MRIHCVYRLITAIVTEKNEQTDNAGKQNTLLI